MRPESPHRGTTRALSVAPMIDRTDRHFRFLMRRLTQHTLLYTEMVNMNAIVRGDRGHILDFDPEEGANALQIGGDDPTMLAEAAKIGVGWGYTEINLNVGCPSNRVQAGCFGAVLMRRPEQVARCVEAMRAAVTVPVTVKHRIGVDELDHYDHMRHFVDVVLAAGADRFTVHARKAWLNGLSPKENRNVPPLRYDDVYRLKRELPHVAIEINGGIKTLDQAAKQLEQVDAVMIGRAAVDTPMVFAQADQRIFGAERTPITRVELVHQMVDYAARFAGPTFKLTHITRHMLTLYAGISGARAWKRALAEGTSGVGASPQAILNALHATEQAQEQQLAAQQTYTR